MKTDSPKDIGAKAGPEDSPGPKKDKTSDSDEYSSDSRVIPEELQKQIIDTVDACKTRECLDFLQSCASKKSSEMYEAERVAKSKKSGKKGVPDEFSMDAAPSKY